MLKVDRSPKPSPSPETPAAQPELTRRNFLALGLGALSAVAVLEAGAAGLLYLRSHAAEGSFGEQIKAGPSDSFPPGSVTEFPDGNFFLIRATDGGFLAVYRRCPHLGCSVNWVSEQQRFYCPCHASSFDMYGNFDNQPVPRPLDTFPISFQDGTVVVDTTTFQLRQQFSPDQLAYCS